MYEFMKTTKKTQQPIRIQQQNDQSYKQPIVTQKKSARSHNRPIETINANDIPPMREVNGNHHSSPKQRMKSHISSQTDESILRTTSKTKLKDLTKDTTTYTNTNHSPCTYKHTLSRMLLAINFNFPFYQNIPILQKLYEPIFKKVIFCGYKKEPKYRDVLLVVKENSGFQGYVCLIKSIEKHATGFLGYFYTNDDVLLNYWNLNYNPHKIWIGKRISLTNVHRLGQHHKGKEWPWWIREKTAERCDDVFREIETLVGHHKQVADNIGIDQTRKTGDGSVGSTKDLSIENFETKSSEILQNSTKSLQGLLHIFKTNVYFESSNITCVTGRSDVLYIPANKSQAFKTVAEMYNNRKVFLEAAIPTILNYLDLKENFIDLDGNYYVDVYGYSKDYYNGKAFLYSHSTELAFSHPFKLTKPLMKMYLEKRFIPDLKLFKNQC